MKVKHEHKPTRGYRPKTGDIVMDCDPRSDHFYGQVLCVEHFDTGPKAFVTGVVLIGNMSNEGTQDCAFIHECKRLTTAKYRQMLVVHRLEGQ